MCFFFFVFFFACVFDIIAVSNSVCRKGGCYSLPCHFFAIFSTTSFLAFFPYYFLCSFLCFYCCPVQLRRYNLACGASVSTEVGCLASVCHGLSVFASQKRSNMAQRGRGGECENILNISLLLLTTTTITTITPVFNIIDNTPVSYCNRIFLLPSFLFFFSFWKFFYFLPWSSSWVYRRASVLNQCVLLW